MRRPPRAPVALPAHLVQIEIVQRAPECLLRVVVADAGEMTLAPRDVWSNRRFRLRCMERLLVVFGRTPATEWNYRVVRALLHRPDYEEKIV